MKSFQIPLFFFPDGFHMCLKYLYFELSDFPCPPFSFVPSLSQHHPAFRTSQWKGRKGPHLSAFILRRWKVLGFGRQLIQSPKSHGGFVTVRVSGLESEKPDMPVSFSQHHACGGDSQTQRSFTCGWSSQVNRGEDQGTWLVPFVQQSIIFLRMADLFAEVFIR